MIEYAGPATVTYLGRPCVEVEQIQIRRISNNKPVKTLAKGLAGPTKGAPEYTLSIRSAVPATGAEVAYDDLVESGRVFQIGVRKAGYEEIFDVWVDDGEDGSEVDTPQTQGVTLHGRRVGKHPI